MEGDVESIVEDYSESEFYVGLVFSVAATVLGLWLSTGVFHFLYALVLGAMLGEETDGFLFVAGVAPHLMRRARVPSGSLLRAAYIVVLGIVEAWAELELPGFLWVTIAVGVVSAGVLIACGRIGRDRLLKWGSGCPRRADFFRGRAGGPTPGVGRGPIFEGTRCGDGNDSCVAPYAAGHQVPTGLPVNTPRRYRNLSTFTGGACSEMPPRLEPLTDVSKRRSKGGSSTRSLVVVLEGYAEESGVREESVGVGAGLVRWSTEAVLQ